MKKKIKQIPSVATILIEYEKLYGKNKARALFNILVDDLEKFVKEQKIEILRELRVKRMPRLCDKCELTFTKITGKIYKEIIDHFLNTEIKNEKGD